MSSGNSGGSDAGRVLNGRYQLISVVGGGGMAQVYKTRDNLLGRVVAVKVLRDQYARDEQFVARFKREAQAAANLAHPNIVNVYDVGQDGDLYYIVMENIVGENLKDLITRSAPLPVDTAISIAAQILSALEFAHRSGLIHRDIKPQNVLITRQGVVKVTDFGIAKSVSDLGLTEAGLALGTAHYFSPEQAKGERVLPQSDIYAVGVSLYEMLTGQLPFESESAIGLAYKHINEAPTPPGLLNPNIPPRLETIVLKALAKDPTQRFGSAAEMEKALRGLEATGTQATTAIPVARPNVTGGSATRQMSRGTPRGRRGSAGGVTPPPRSGYMAASLRSEAAGATVASAATRNMASPLAAPTSVAMRPVRAQIGPGGCATVGVALLAVGILTVVVAVAVWFGPAIASFLSPQAVVPSPTPTPTVPTNTPTFTPTRTPTATSTATPSPTNTPISVKVPKLVGLKTGEARALATQVGFPMQEIGRVETLDFPEDVVFQQDPLPDTMFRKGNLIRVRVSDGPPPVALPSLTNTDPQAAKATLEAAGFKVELANEGSLNIPKGVVTRTDPPAGTEVKPGRTVRLFVSLGEAVEVPNLKGMQDLATAQQRLTSIGLTLGAVTEVGRADVGDDIDSVPPGAVYSQDPANGTWVSKGSPINIRLRRRE